MENLTSALIDTDLDTISRQRLALYRFENDLSWEALARRMVKAGYTLQPKTLQGALTGRARPNDRTRWKIKAFIARLDQEPAAPRKRRRVA